MLCILKFLELLTQHNGKNSLNFVLKITCAEQTWQENIHEKLMVMWKKVILYLILCFLLFFFNKWNKIIDETKEASLKAMSQIFNLW